MAKFTEQSLVFMVASAFFIAAVSIFTWVSYVDKAVQPADGWFTVDEFFVPDHKANSNPTIEFERTIKRDMAGSWSVETQLFNGARWITVCRGSGVSNYSTDEDLPDDVTLNWYRGKCEEKPGKYRLQTAWLFSDKEGLTRAVLHQSNEFNVN